MSFKKAYKYIFVIGNCFDNLRSKIAEERNNPTSLSEDFLITWIFENLVKGSLGRESIFFFIFNIQQIHITRVKMSILLKHLFKGWFEMLECLGRVAINHNIQFDLIEVHLILK